jgi:hypothetical protein
VDDGRLKGIALQAEIAAAPEEQRLLNVEEAVTCRTQFIRESQAQLIHLPAGTLVITDELLSQLFPQLSHITNHFLPARV